MSISDFFVFLRCGCPPPPLIAPAPPDERARSMQRATCNTQRATCSMQRAACNMQRATPAVPTTSHPNRVTASATTRPARFAVHGDGRASQRSVRSAEPDEARACSGTAQTRATHCRRPLPSAPRGTVDSVSTQCTGRGRRRRCSRARPCRARLAARPCGRSCRPAPQPQPTATQRGMHQDAAPAGHATTQPARVAQGNHAVPRMPRAHYLLLQVPHPRLAAIPLDERTQRLVLHLDLIILQPTCLPRTGRLPRHIGPGLGNIGPGRTTAAHLPRATWAAGSAARS